MSKVISIDPRQPDRRRLSQAAEIIRRKGLVAFPTDTFYGLAADPFDPDTLARLFSIKGRSASKAILLLIDELARLDGLVSEVSPLAEAVMKAFWPGPLTLIFKAAASLPPSLTAGKGTIGIRLPAAPISLGLIRECGFPLTATSANRSGEASPDTAADVAKTIGPALDLILDGGPCSSPPSTLLDLTRLRPRLLREGAFPTQDLMQFFKARRVDLQVSPTE